MQTILITGCSSGFGREIAQYFLDRDWQVVATMRTPDADVLPKSERLRLLPLDVTNADSIRKAIADAGPIDVLVNNAGIGMLGAVEALDMDKVRGVFETNTFGTFALTQAVLPQFRERRAGVVANVTSSVTVRPLTLLAFYTASKAAVNAFTECLALEMAPFNVRTRIVLPGRAPGTKFAENARDRLAIPEPYADLAKAVFDNFADVSLVTHAQDVAEGVWRAVTDAGSPMFIHAGADALAEAKAAAERARQG